MSSGVCKDFEKEEKKKVTRFANGLEYREHCVLVSVLDCVGQVG